MPKPTSLWVLLFLSVGSAQAQSYDLDTEAFEGSPGCGSFVEASITIVNNDSSNYYLVEITGTATNAIPGPSNCPSMSGCSIQTTIPCEIVLDATLSIEPGKSGAKSGVTPLVSNDDDPATCQTGCANCDNPCPTIDFCVDFGTSLSATVVGYSPWGTSWIRVNPPIDLGTFTVTNFCD